MKDAGLPKDVQESTAPTAIPFSRRFRIERLHQREDVEVTIEADATERAALASIDGLQRVDRLAAHFRVSPLGPQGARVRGEVTASVIQTCVVSLEPIEAEVHETVDLRFAPDADVAAAEAAWKLALEDPATDLEHLEEPPDPIVDGELDLGVIAAEFLALGLDPYPKKPDAKLEYDAGDSRDEGDTVSPFAALQRLKGRDDGESLD
jgi:uncharacterized metal-binding protein YceD (DUF177 family)